MYLFVNGGVEGRVVNMLKYMKVTKIIFLLVRFSVQRQHLNTIRIVFSEAHNLFDLKVEMGFREGGYLSSFGAFWLSGQS